MPLSLKQLEDRRDNCVDKIIELKQAVEGIGRNEIGNIQFNTKDFFTGLTTMDQHSLEAFTKLFPQLPRILEFCRQAAEKERKRRKVQEQKATKISQFYQNQERKARKATKRINKIKGSGHSRIKREGQDSSQSSSAMETEYVSMEDIRDAPKRDTSASPKEDNKVAIIEEAYGDRRTLKDVFFINYIGMNRRTPDTEGARKQDNRRILCNVSGNQL